MVDNLRVAFGNCKGLLKVYLDAINLAFFVLY